MVATAPASLVTKVDSLVKLATVRRGGLSLSSHTPYASSFPLLLSRRTNPQKAPQAAPEWARVHSPNACTR